MCWYCKNNDLAKLKIAENDIKVFKVVERVTPRIVSYYVGSDGFVYGLVKNGENVVNGDGIFKYYGEIMFEGRTVYGAIHSYSYNERFSKPFIEEDEFCTILYIGKDEGYMATATYDLSAFDTLIMDCVIPAGSKYAINEKGEVISDTIKVLGFIEPIDFVNNLPN